MAIELEQISNVNRKLKTKKIFEVTRHIKELLPFEQPVNCVVAIGL